MYEIGQEYDNVELSVIPGITAANSGAAVLGAPLNHDFCTISLSDLLTPWDKIEKRLVAAAEGDFVIALYNPSSHKRKDYLMRACDILLRAIERIEPAAMSKISDVREQAIRSVLSVNSAVHRSTCLRRYLSAMRVHK